MWVEKNKQGSYKFTERYRDTLTDKYRRVSVTLDKNNANTRKLAEKLLQEKIDKVLGESKTVIRLSDVIEDYLKYQSMTVKQSTYYRNESFCKYIENLLGGNILIDNITAKYVKTKLLSTGKSPGALNELLKRYKALIRWAYKNDYVEDIRYLDKLESFKDTTKREKIKDKFLESSELKLLLDGMTLDKWRLVTEFLALSGLRIGELMALEKNDIEINKNVIHVNKNYDTINDVTTSTKTLCSNRDIYIQDELKSVIHSINSLRGQLQLLGEMTRNDLFVPGVNNDHLEYDAYRKYLREKALATIGRSITPHVLRHTHASLLMEQGVNIDTISRRLGHENSRITKEIYLHVTETLTRKDFTEVESVRLLS